MSKQETSPRIIEFGTKLGLSISIEKIHKRHKERLDKFSVVTNLVTDDGKTYETYLYNAKGIYEICRWSRKEKANQFYDWVYDVLESIRKTGQYSTKDPEEQKMINKKAELLLRTAKSLNKGEERDKILNEIVFMLTGKDFKIKEKSSVSDEDKALEAYKWTIEWIKNNIDNFTESNKNAWGRINEEEGYCLVNKNIYMGKLTIAGYKAEEMIKYFAKNCMIIKNSQDRFSYHTTTGERKGYYLKFILGVDE